MQKSVVAWLQVCMTACIWVILFRLNAWLFSAFDWAELVISWIFLPAAVRLLGVMLFGWRGALGIWFGTMYLTQGTLFESNLLEALGVATLSALGSLVAVSLTMRYLKIQLDLQGLTTKQLIAFSVVGAMCNVIPHNLFFWIVGIAANPFDGIPPMFIGDILGTVIVFYTLRSLLVALERFTQRPSY
jgi:hypothetical protein